MTLGEELRKLQIHPRAHVLKERHRRISDRRGAALEVVENRVGKGDVLERHRAEARTVLLARDPVAVRRLVEHHHEERFTRLAGLIENSLADFREVFSRILAFIDFSCNFSIAVRDIKPWVVIDALALINHPAVPIVSANGVWSAAMEFTDKRCVVAALSQVAADGFDFRRKTHENRNSVFVAVLPG